MTSKDDIVDDVADAAAATADDTATTAQPVSEGEAADAIRAQYLRLAADFENFKRRKTQESLDAARYSNETAARELLPLLDNLQRSLDHAPQGDDAVAGFVSGIQMVVREFEAALERLGVTRIATVGEAFDPGVHEAIGGEESADVEVDTVITELQAGYRLHDRVLRPALVRIAHPVAR